MSDEDWAAARAAHARGDYATELRIYRRLADAGRRARRRTTSASSTSAVSACRRATPRPSSGIGRPRSKASANAQNNLGVMYEMGHGVPKDPAEAVKWYRCAADQDDIHAQHNLGNMYESGQGVAQDYAEAVAWFRKAAEQRPSDGAGQPRRDVRARPRRAQDLVQAHMWFALSAAGFPASEAKNRGIATRNRDELAALA